jgi:hypothetical protein
LKPTDDLAIPAAESAVCCDVAAFGVVRSTPDDLKSQRQNPGVVPGEPLPPAFLKHADEQTVVALAAVLRAIHAHGLGTLSFRDWGVLAAPRFQGRIAMAVAIQRYLAEGAWGISPHLIPHRSLHAVSGTISQVLKIHGPNFGVGGGPGSAGELFLTAAALLGRGNVPGLWVVLTGWDQEPAPTREGRCDNAGVCSALALALLPARPEARGLRLRLLPPCRQEQAAPGAAETLGPGSLERLLAVLANGRWPRTTVIWRLEGGGCLQLEGGGDGEWQAGLREDAAGAGRAAGPHAVAISSWPGSKNGPAREDQAPFTGQAPAGSER